MTTRTRTALTLVAVCAFAIGCDSADPPAESPPLELGVFEAQVSGDVTESVRGEAVFGVQRSQTGDIFFTLFLYGTEEPGGESRIFEFVYDGVPDVGVYRMPGPDDPDDTSEFRGGYRVGGYTIRGITTGGTVDIRAVSETALEGSFDFTAYLVTDRGERQGEVSVVGRFHAEEGDVGDS